MSLTYRQRAFVEYFLGGPEVQWNATGAARKAGYKHPNKQGPRLLVNVGIQRHIADRLHEMGATTDELIWRWLSRMRADISPFVSATGLDVEGLKEAGLGFLIKGVRQTKDATTILLRDPDVAEDRLARHLGMFTDTTKVEDREALQKALESVANAFVAAGNRDGKPSGAEVRDRRPLGTIAVRDRLSQVGC